MSVTYTDSMQVAVRDNMGTYINKHKHKQTNTHTHTHTHTQRPDLGLYIYTPNAWTPNFNGLHFLFGLCMLAHVTWASISMT